MLQMRRMKTKKSSPLPAAMQVGRDRSLRPKSKADSWLAVSKSRMARDSQLMRKTLVQGKSSKRTKMTVKSMQVHLIIQATMIQALLTRLSRGRAPPP